MRVLMLSKACVVGAYQRKLEELAALPGMELLVIVPPYWQEETRRTELERLHTRGYRLEVEPIRFNGRFHFFHFQGLGRHVATFRPDILHIDEEPYNLATWLAVRLGRRAGARSLFFTWQNIYHRYPPPFNLMERHCFEAVDRAIAGNAEAVGVLRRKGFRKPVDVIPQFGVDPEIFKPLAGDAAKGRKGEREKGSRGDTATRRGGDAARETPGSPCPSTPSTSSTGSETSARHQFTIGYVGRLVAQKGIEDLLAAAARLEGDRHLVLVGAGPHQGALEARAAALGIGAQFQVVPPVPSWKVPEVMNSLDALVLPSRTRDNWKEQFGRVLVEAMACQVPVVGSDSGEIPQVVGEAGLIYPEGNVEALAAHLRALQASPDRRDELGRRGRARVLARFTHARIAEETYRVYQQMLAGDSGRRVEGPGPATR